MGAIPELEPHCGSWICTSQDADSGHPIREVWTEQDAETLAARGWVVETAAQYLGRLNRAIRLADERRRALAAFDAEYAPGDRGALDVT